MDPEHCWQGEKNGTIVKKINVFLHIFLLSGIRNTHKTSGFKTSGLQASGLQNVRFTKCQVFKMSGCKKTSIYILYLWLLEIRRFSCRHVCRQILKPDVLNLTFWNRTFCGCTRNTDCQVLNWTQIMLYIPGLWIRNDFLILSDPTPDPAKSFIREVLFRSHSG